MCREDSLRSVLNPDFPFGSGFTLPDGSGAFEFCNGPLASLEGFSAMFPDGNDQHNIFTDVDGTDEWPEGVQGFESETVGLGQLVNLTSSNFNDFTELVV